MEKNIRFSIAFILFLLCQVLQAQPGSLDSTFGTAGIAIMDQYFFANVGVYPDGKILAFKGIETPDLSYDILLRRYNQDGSPDNSFGTNSFRVIDLSTPNSQDHSSELPQSIAIVADGKVLIGGNYGAKDSSGASFVDVFLIRLDYNGQFDSTFGINGRVVLDVDNKGNYLNEISVLPDNRIVLFVTSHWTTFPYQDYSFVRLMEEGSLDDSFGQGGVATHPKEEINLGYAHFCTHADGKITLAGQFDPFTSLYQFDNNGKPDSTFGQNGHILANISGYLEIVRQTVALKDGKVLTCGWGYLGGNTVISVCRFLPNGNPDSTFHDDGILLDPIAAFDSESYGISVQPDGKIIVAGYGIFSDLEPDWLLVRYNTDGTPDQSFGNGGYVRTDFHSPWYESISYITLLSEGKILAVGYSDLGWTIARFNTGLSVSVSDLETENKKTMRLFPNPVLPDKSLKIRHYLSATEKCTILISGMDGRLLHREELIGECGWNENLLQIPNLPETGVFVLKIQTSTGMQSSQFVKI